MAGNRSAAKSKMIHRAKKALPSPNPLCLLGLELGALNSGSCSKLADMEVEPWVVQDGPGSSRFLSVKPHDRHVSRLHLSGWSGETLQRLCARSRTKDRWVSEEPE